MKIQRYYNVAEMETVFLIQLSHRELIRLPWRVRLILWGMGVILRVLSWRNEAPAPL